jgi:hypothetical protein
MVHILLKQIKFKLLLKYVKHNLFVLLNAFDTHSVEWIRVCVVGGLASDGDTLIIAVSTTETCW